jgi:NAD(P) transhydrogenase subunit beta
MPQGWGNTVWAGTGFLLAIALAAVLAGMEQLAVASRGRRHGRLCAMLPTAALAGLLAAGVGAGSDVVAAAIAGAVLGAWRVRRRDLTRRPYLIASLGIGMGLAALSGGFARYLSATPYAKAAVARGELCAVVLIGALILAASTIAFCKLRGAIGACAGRVPAIPSSTSRHSCWNPRRPSGSPRCSR